MDNGISSQLWDLKGDTDDDHDYDNHGISSQLWDLKQDNQRYKQPHRQALAPNCGI